MSQARCKYHHGDLRNALIVAAAELIERNGSLDFSMAEAAASAGVSAAAPYRHFADKEELLRAVRELAILGLGYVAADTAAKHPAGSIDSILAMGHTYLGYARAKRAFFSKSKRAFFADHHIRYSIENHRKRSSRFGLVPATDFGG